MTAAGRDFIAAGWAQATCLGRSLLWVWDHTLGWPIMWLLVGVIRGYQLVVSPVLPPTCRFYPSCSSYALLAIRRHGSAKGLALAGWRLLRCNPFNAGGVDPVPSPGTWRCPAPGNDPATSDGAHVHP